MKRLILFASVFILLFISYSHGEDTFSGSVFLGGRALNLDHQSAKFNEYNGMVPGLFGGAGVDYNTESYYLRGDGAYLGDDDFFVRLKGGKWGAFKYSLYFNEFPHNLSFKARSLFTTPGSDNLSFTGNGSSAGVTDLSRWDGTFDYKLRRRDTGGAFDLTALKPFFLTFDANRLEREGQIPWAGTSGQAGFKTVQMPLPIDNTTTNINGLAGWRSKRFYVALGGGFSKFTNDAEFVRFRDPFTTGTAVSTGTTLGAPDNKSWNLKFTGTSKLPMNSTFSLTGGYERNTSETTILTTIDQLGPPNPLDLTTNRSTFHGDIQYWNVAATLTSSPVKSLDTKLYFKYFDKKNKNDPVVFSTPGVTGSTPVATEIASYQKTTLGADASYRFLKNLKGILGYEFADLRRRVQEFEAGESSTEEGVTGFHGNEAQLPDTWDHKVTAQLVYNPLDWLGARLKYQKLYRNAHFVFNEVDPTAALDDQLNAALENNFRRFDISNKEQDLFKITGDVTPFAGLDFTFEYAYKLDRYKKNDLGYQKAQSNEFIIDGGYDFKGIKFFGFFDYDTSYTKQRSRFATPTATPAPSGDPNSAPNVNSFNWDVKLDNNNYAYGFGTAFPIIKDKLTFTVQYDFEKNNGTADFTSQAFAANQASLGLNQDNIDILPWDDYTRQSISARAMYNFNKSLNFVFGYVYSQFRLNDGQLNGYRLVVPGANTLLSGAYIDQSYKVNLFYVKTVYQF